MVWEARDEPDEYTRQGQTGPMPVWSGQDPAGYPQQDRIPPGYGTAPPTEYAPQGYGYAPPGYGAPGWMPGYVVMPGPPPRSHLGRAIVGLFFCWPLAVAAIVQASRVEKHYARGDYDGALRSARNARICANISISVGIFFVALAIVALVLAGGDPATGGSVAGAAAFF